MHSTEMLDRRCCRYAPATRLRPHQLLMHDFCAPIRAQGTALHRRPTDDSPPFHALHSRILESMVRSGVLKV